MNRHNHEDVDRLTSGCDECVARVRADQFWAKFIEECDNPDNEDHEFGLGSPVIAVWNEWEDDGRIEQYARFIPDGLLTAILIEHEAAGSLGAVMSEAGQRLDRHVRGLA